jgi:hypothetical protein
MAVAGSRYLSCRPDVHHADREWCPKGEMTITPLQPGRPVTLAGPEGATGDGMPLPDPGAGPAQGATAITGPVERGIWSLVWLGVIIGGIGLWGSWTAWWFAAVAAPAVLLVGAVGLAVTWLVKNPRSQGIQLSAMGSVVVMTLISQGIGIHTRIFYSTDSAAFNQVAARLMVHGINPYTASMNSASKLLNGASNYWTYTVTGSHVSAVSYPAGAFLFDVPAMLLGFHHEVVDWMDLYAWIVTAVLIYVLVPVTVRWLAPLLLLVSIFTGVFASGGSDAAFLPFLVLAVWRWDRFGLDRSAGVARWMGPVALGLACSIKQTPWFCIPFLVVGVFIEARNSGRKPWPLAGRYLAIVVGVFAVINLPFVIWSPRAWIRDTILPFNQPLVTDGQGLVTLALHGIGGGVSMRLLSAAGFLVLVALLAALVLWYPRMKPAWMLLLPIGFFVAPRSLFTYLIDLYPAALVAAVSVSAVRRPEGRAARAHTTRRSRRPLVLAVAIPMAAAVALTVLAFLSAPLELGVRSVRASQGAALINAVTLRVANTTGQTVDPRFMVNVGSSHPNGFWHQAGGGQVVIGPHQSAVVTLLPPGPFGAPAHDSNWLVEAYTSSPEALSTSPLMYWTLGTSPGVTTPPAPVARRPREVPRHHR